MMCQIEGSDCVAYRAEGRLVSCNLTAALAEITRGDHSLCIVMVV